MTSDTDDLEEALRENLKLRRELAANVTKAEAASQRGGMAYRLGWVLYWICLSVAILWIAVWIGRFFADTAPLPPLLHLILFWLPAIILYGLGRAFRYVLSGE